nr:DUF982 domain-containing protein [Rhizobium sp. Root1220]
MDQPNSPGPWNECVLARTGASGGLEFVGTTRRAAALLANKWPSDGPAFRTAVQTCNDVLRSWLPTYLARISFEEAVREASLSP